MECRVYVPKIVCKHLKENFKHFQKNSPIRGDSAFFVLLLTTQLICALYYRSYTKFPGNWKAPPHKKSTTKQIKLKVLNCKLIIAENDIFTTNLFVVYLLSLSLSLS